MGCTDYEIEVYNFDPEVKKILNSVSPETLDQIAEDIQEKSGYPAGSFNISNQIEISEAGDSVVSALEKYSKDFPGFYFKVQYFGEGTDERGTIGILNGTSIDKPIEVIWPQISIAELIDGAQPASAQVKITREEWLKELMELVPEAHCTADGDFPDEDDQDIYSIEFGYKSYEAWYDSEDKRWVNVDGCDIQIPEGTPVYWGQGICIEYLYNLQKKNFKE
jgi:hypothetical protein